MNEHVETLRQLRDRLAVVTSPMDYHEGDRPEVAAINAAIAALQSKSDAQVVVEWLEKHRNYRLSFTYPCAPDFRAGTCIMVSNHASETKCVQAPTLHDLAEKLRSLT